MSNQYQKGQARGGIGFCGLLTVVFITLKLLKVIDWAWGWVLAPLWMPLSLWLLFTVITLVIVIIRD